ncbi:phosphoadenylyl-sulfate reductase [Seleniivibrio woodruffii]|uniref:phosphoadenylyl-sulfate reductase n=1 Tax=Seleniivibrio woodruffii TaxID=1078050 RepID=UPI0039E59323
MSYKDISAEWRVEESLAALRFFLGRFKKYTVAFSQQAEDVLLLDLVKQIDPNPDVFSIDTGKLFKEAAEYNRSIEEFYGIKINVIRPDEGEVERMVAEHGEQLYYESAELRKHCCHVRKVNPLQKYLKDFPLWLTGLRKQQSPTRTDLETIEYDEATGVYKLSPLLGWTTNQMFDYIEAKKIPLNPLYEQGYPSIGCACCTRPVQPGEDIRRGRWWWEDPTQKECGLHVKHK